MGVEDGEEMARDFERDIGEKRKRGREECWTPWRDGDE